MANILKVTLIRSTIGVKPQHKKTVEALGLRKIHQVVEQPDNPQIRGMIHQVQHLVSVEEI
ncbi:MAG: 50S ribosomal protein L30 [Thermotaleaceae bacterium]